VGPLRFGAIGAGFWARCQLAGWGEVPGAECVAIADPRRGAAESLAAQLGVPAVYESAAELLDRERPDFVDVITPVETHFELVSLAAGRRVPVICQKPMAPTLEQAEAMVRECREAAVPFFVHENWRWQTPIRAMHQALASGRIGRPFRARITMVSGFPVFKNQPALAELERFVLADMGSHILDLPRFLFGEATRLYAETHRVHRDIRGEDVATVMLRMRAADGGETTVTCEMGYPEHYLELDAFPQTLILIEGERGSLELARDYWVRETTAEGTFSRRVPPPAYPWADPAYAVAQTSTVACNASLLRALRGEGPAETTGEDNLRTVRLIFAAYESAASGRAVALDGGA